jgi:protein-tyrosine phosphatase
VPRFSVLFVCVGNICRSPMGERLLAARLPADRFEVASAGVGALVGSAMHPEAADLLVSYGGSATGFAARQLESWLTDGADLVLTATKQLRSRVLADTPSALPRTFTVREFAALAEPDGDPHRVVAQAASRRSVVPTDQLDIPDPYGRGAEAHQLAARLTADAVDRIAQALTGPAG